MCINFLSDYVFAPRHAGYVLLAFLYSSWSLRNKIGKSSFYTETLSLPFLYARHRAEPQKAVSGHSERFRRNLRTNSLLVLFQLCHKRALVSVLEVFCSRGSAHAACPVSGSPAAPVDGCLPNQALESLLFLLCPWVSATSPFLTAQLGALPLWFVASSKQLTWIQYFSFYSKLCLPTTTQVGTLTLSSLQIPYPQWKACPSSSDPPAGETFRACSVFSPSTTEQSKTNSKLNRTEPGDEALMLSVFIKVAVSN